MAVSISIVFADVSVGVKQGDWIQYNVHVTGNPPGDHNIQWASMNVTDVQGTTITLDIQTLFNNGTLYPEHITLNLATGILGDDFFIPKNLNVGDKFYDAYQGNITITSMQQQDNRRRRAHSGFRRNKLHVLCLGSGKRDTLVAATFD